MRCIDWRADRGAGIKARSRVVHRRNQRRGVLLIYAIILVPLLILIGLLAVDAGALLVANGELQECADDAARYAATGLREDDAKEAIKRVKNVLKDHKIGGESPKYMDGDVEFGLWDPVTRSLKILPEGAENGATAVRVTVRLGSDSKNGVASLFGGILGYDSYSVTASATATIGEPINVTVPAKACPYLAGMPGPDGDIPFERRTSSTPSHTTVAQSAPAQVMIDLEPGQVLYFRDVEGSTGDAGTGITYGLEGNLARPNIAQRAVNGFQTTKAPLNSLLGVFLGDQRPDQSPYVPGLDYSSSWLRERIEQDPQPKQIFFIGDGVRNSDQKLQRFIVPEGATRLYLGLSDELGWWWDNFGEYRSTVFTGDVRVVD